MSDDLLRGHLEAIYKKHGELSTKIVVNEARKKTHPLHSYIFHVSKEEAAEAYYHERARELITRFKVIYERPGDERGPLSVRAFHAVRTEKGHIYEPLERVASDPLLREMLLRDMERDWKALYRRFQEFEEFLEMVRADVG